MINNISRFIKRKISNELKVKIKYYFKMIKNADFRRTMQYNIKYKNIADGRRCFILGNGPSLNNVNVELLKDEDVFTVNQINRTSIFNKIKPKYHCLADDEFFFLDDNNPIEAERLKYVKLLQENKNLICIFPYYSKVFFENIGFSNEVVYYNYIQDGISNPIKPYSMTKGIPGIRTVVQVAIYSAIYFGYKEIYLLGVENTNYSSLLNKIENTNIIEEAHVYKYTKCEEEAILSKKNSITNEFIFKNFSDLFKIYHNIKDYCDKNKIKIMNLTGCGILDVFEQEKLENIIK